MGIKKERQRLALTNMQASAIGSFGTLNVSSTLAIRNVSVTNVGSFNDLTITTIRGDNQWRGITTVLSGQTTKIQSTSLVNSGFPILVSLNNISVDSHADIVVSANSVTDGGSFMVTLNKATGDDQEIAWSVFN